MSTTITIRVEPDLREALRTRAEEEGKPLSKYIREVLERELAGAPLGDRVAHLKGRLAPTDERLEGWRARLRKRNWRS